MDPQPCMQSKQTRIPQGGLFSCVEPRYANLFCHTAGTYSRWWHLPIHQLFHLISCKPTPKRRIIDILHILRNWSKSRNYKDRWKIDNAKKMFVHTQKKIPLLVRQGNLVHRSKVKAIEGCADPHRGCQDPALKTSQKMTIGNMWAKTLRQDF